MSTQIQFGSSFYHDHAQLSAQAYDANGQLKWYDISYRTGWEIIAAILRCMLRTLWWNVVYAIAPATFRRKLDAGARLR